MYSFSFKSPRMVGWNSRGAPARALPPAGDSNGQEQSGRRGRRDPLPALYAGDRLRFVRAGGRKNRCGAVVFGRLLWSDVFFFVWGGGMKIATRMSCSLFLRLYGRFWVTVGVFDPWQPNCLLESVLASFFLVRSKMVVDISETARWPQLFFQTTSNQVSPSNFSFSRLFWLMLSLNYCFFLCLAPVNCFFWKGWKHQLLAKLPSERVQGKVNGEVLPVRPGRSLTGAENRQMESHRACFVFFTIMFSVLKV